MKYNITITKHGATAFTWKAALEDGHTFDSYKDGPYTVFASFDKAADAACNCVRLRDAANRFREGLGI